MNKTNNIVIIIKTLLSIHKLTQVDFAIKTGIPLATVKKYLQGAFNKKIARSLRLLQVGDELLFL